MLAVRGRRAGRSSRPRSALRPSREGGLAQRRTCAPLTRLSTATVASRSRPARGPCTIASATARLRVTVGPGAIALEESIELDDLRPVDVLRRRRLVVHGGDRGLQLVRAEWLACTAPDGALVPLAEQDRARWDRPAIAEGLALVTASLAKGGHAFGSGRNRGRSVRWAVVRRLRRRGWRLRRRSRRGP